MARRNFTKEEERFIIENYFKLSPQEIADTLGRTKVSIVIKANRLNIDRNFNPEDDVDCLEGEIWKDVPGYEGYYQASNTGRVRSVTRFSGTGKLCKGIILKNWKDDDGYLRITLQKDGRTKFTGVHKIVAMCFLENKNNYNEVNHKDENKQNNCVENLEWCDSKYNNNYGTKLIRSAKSRSKPVIMRDKDYKYLKSFDSLKQIQDELGFNYTDIERACYEFCGMSYGYRWNWKYGSLRTNKKGNSYFYGISNKERERKYGRTENNTEAGTCSD